MSKLLEELAELEHSQWIHWTTHMIDNPDKVNLWSRLMETPYSELTNKEKEGHRTWAKKAIEIMKANGKKASTVIPGDFDFSDINEASKNKSDPDFVNNALKNAGIR